MNSWIHYILPFVISCKKAWLSVSETDRSPATIPLITVNCKISFGVG